MKTIAGILVAAAALMMACGSMYDESEFRKSEQMLSAQESTTGDYTTLATKDCSVSIQCADGTSRSCSGTSGSCSASGSGDGSVTCNGTTYYCPSTPCTSDGYCDLSCSSDPDCTFCKGGTRCYSNSDCGMEGFCSNNSCICY